MFPDGGLRCTEAHHLTHRVDGGGTALDSRVLRSRYHHGPVPQRRVLHARGLEALDEACFGG